MQFLNPKTDFAFKKVFGSETSQDILISFLNAILDLTGEETIENVKILDPYLAPKIEGLKNTFLDVRVIDQKGRSYIVEMQILNVEGFEKRILYNACKAYVNQLGKGDPYHLLSNVVAVTITDFNLFPTLQQTVNRFRLSAEENPLIYHQALSLVFAELPKFTKQENELSTTLDRWFYFLKMAPHLTGIPSALAVESTIVKALEVVNYASWTKEELDSFEKREMWIGEQQYIYKRLRHAQEEAEIAKKEAKTAKEKVIAAQEEVTAAKKEAKTAKEKVIAAKEEATAAKEEAETAKEKVITAQEEATAAQEEAEIAKEKVIAAQEEAETAKKEARLAQKAVILAEEKGHSKGKSKGKAEILIRLLRRRFGVVSDEYEKRIHAASNEQLDAWSESFLDTNNLSDLFSNQNYISI